MKIISGGQTGADLAALWSAKIFGIETGGFAPKGWQTQHGPQPSLKNVFGLKESDSGYHGRTLQNCESSDITVIFASNIRSPGTKLTLHHCTSNNIRYRVYPFGKNFMAKVEDHTESLISVITHQRRPINEITINVGGNSTETSPHSFTVTFITLTQVFKRLGYSQVCEGDLTNLEQILRDSYELSSMIA